MCLIKAKDIISQTRTYFTGAEAKRFALTGKGQSLLQLGRTAVQNQKKYGAETWYDWCIANWGTKWNAMEVYINEDSQQIYFDTAWSFPESIAYALAEQFPESEFLWIYADEDRGRNTGCFEYVDGETDRVSYDNNSAEAYECYASLWGEDPCLEQGENDD